MTSAEWTPWIFATLGAWAVLFYCQLGDLLAERAGLRAGASEAEAGARRTTSVRVLFGAVVLFIAAVWVVDIAARLIGTTGSGSNPAVGALLLIVLAVLLAVVATTTLFAVTDAGGAGYSRLRTELARHEHSRVTRDDIARFRSELDSLDADRTTYRDGKRVPWWHFVPALVGLLAVLSLLLGAEPRWWLGLLALLLPSASIQVAIATAGVRATRLRAAATADETLRVGVVTALDLLERRAARGIPGLSDRVSRALQILREQEKK
ncbi:MAG: hypothetical protein ABWX66_05970 [Lacisediminihabitans sp.]